MIQYFTDPEVKKVLYQLRDKYFSDYYSQIKTWDDFVSYEDRKLIQKFNDRKIMFDAGFDAMLDILDKIPEGLQKQQE